MGQFFTEISENALNHDLFCHPKDYIVKPFQTTIDFISILFSPIILPGYFLALAVAVFAELIISIGYIGYFFIKRNEADGNQSLVESRRKGSVAFQMFCVSVGVAPLMVVVFLLRLVATLISAIIKTMSLNEGGIMRNDNDLSLECIWGLVAACCVASAGFFWAARPNEPLNRRDYGAINGPSDDLVKRKIKREALARYTALIITAHNDDKIIMKQLENHNREAGAYYKEQYKNTDKMDIPEQNDQQHQSLLKFSYFQAPDALIALHRQGEQKAELRSLLKELMGSYPDDSFEDEETYRLATSEDIEMASGLYEEHHNKVIEIATLMFPNLLAFLNMVKQLDEANSTVMKVSQV